jgi:ATP diphosphatase
VAVGLARLHRTGQLDGITEALPSLISAEKIQKRVARVGFDWGSVEPVFDKVQEELEEVRDAASKELGASDQVAEEVGDLLFAVVNLARHLKVNPEVALRAGNKKFVKRFQAMEILIDQQGEVLEELPLDAIDDYWKEVKKALDEGL